MKIPNKRDLQQITINHLCDINSEEFMKICKRCTENVCLLVYDINLASDNFSHFRRKVSERTLNVIMRIDEKIRVEKVQYDINGKTAKY